MAAPTWDEQQKRQSGRARRIRCIGTTRPHYSTVTQPNHLQTVVAEVDVDGQQHLVKFSRYYDNAQFWTVPGERDGAVTRAAHRDRDRA